MPLSCPWHRSRVAFVLVAALCLVEPADAQPTAALAGVVVDATGGPLTDAAITVRGSVERSARTGADGRFAIEKLPAGDYDLTADAIGFAPARQSLRVQPGETAEVRLVLEVTLQEHTVVTATKVGERDVHTVPMAVSVLPGDQLARADVHTVEQLAGLSPSVTFSQNTGFAQLTIRGIGTNVVFAGSDPSSAVYLDGVYLARPAGVLADFVDVERVEVLRGPQGTLYGRNVVGGAVNIVSRMPTDDPEASVRLVAGSPGEMRTTARVSGPLVRGRVMGSATLLRGVRDGFVRDLDHPQDPLGGEDVTAALGRLRVILNRRSELVFSADTTRQDPTPIGYPKVLAVKPGFQVDNPADLHEVHTSVPAVSERIQNGGSMRLTAEIAPATTVTSLTAYRTLDYELTVDGDITELDLTVSNVHDIQHQWSEELTIAHQGSRLTWIGGLFAFDEADRQPTRVGLGGLGVTNQLDPEVDSRSLAIFGQATVSLTTRLSATAGLRYTNEDKSIVNGGRLVSLGTPAVVVAGSAYDYADSISHAAWTPKLGLEARLAEGRLAYVSATRGFKSGGFNLTSREAGRGYAPEFVWSYEGGLKMVAARGRATLDLAAFHADYTDLQVQTTIFPGVIDISNAATAVIRGLEAEGAIRVTPAIQVGGHAAWLAAKYDHLRRGRRRRRPGRRRRPSIEQRAGVDRPAVAGVDPGGRRRHPAVATGRCAGPEYRLLHALQRRGPAAGAVRPAGRERGTARAQRPVGLRGLRAQPDQRGLHHRHVQFAAAGDRRTAGRFPSGRRCSSR